MLPVINELHFSNRADPRFVAESLNAMQRAETTCGTDTAVFYSGHEFVSEPEDGFTWLPGHA